MHQMCLSFCEDRARGTYPEVLLVCLLQQPSALVGAPEDLLPAQADAHQQVLDVDSVLLAAPVLQVRARPVQRRHALTLGRQVRAHRLGIGTTVRHIILGIAYFTTASYDTTAFLP